MMKFTVRLTCTLLCAIFFSLVFAPFSYAKRNEVVSLENQTDAISENVLRPSRSCQLSEHALRSNKRSFYCQTEADDENVTTFINPQVSVSEFAPPGAVNAGYSSSETWIVLQDSDRAEKPPVRGNMDRVTLALSSNASRTISISATARSNGIIRKMGLQSIKLQRYYRSKWVTVYSVADQYCYKISRFIYTNTRYNLVSGNYYRVVATFLGDTGSNVTRVTRTSGAIKCR